MSEPIHDYGFDADNNKVSRGRFVIDGNGHLFVVPLTSTVKPSHRFATQDEIDARRAPAPAPAPAPADEPIEEVVEAIEIDAPLEDYRDRD